MILWVMMAMMSDELYGYCTEDINPPPLLPRKYKCQTFPRRRTNLFQHLGLNTTLPSSEKNIVIHNVMPDILSYQVYKKDLEKYLGLEYQTLSIDHQTLSVDHSKKQRFLDIDPWKLKVKPMEQTAESRVYS